MEEKCPKCGANIKKFWHRLTPGLVSALVKAMRTVAAKKQNKFHLYKDLIDGNKLTTQEQMNWTKLRFHGMVAKYKEDGLWKRGYWLITQRGYNFLQNKVVVPARVLTFRNRVEERDTKMLGISDVLGLSPYFENIDDIQYEFADISDMETTFDEDGQGKLF